jgi:hypothetical protein
MSSLGAPLKVFCSYAHEDEVLCQQLYAHLRPLERQGLLALWHDRLIAAGTDWAEAIDVHLTTASLILLLISPDFFVSDYCYGIEMDTALKRHQANEALVVPILLRPVDWTGVPFARLRALPTNAKPVTTWSNQDQAFADVVAGIRQVIETLSLPNTSTQWLSPGPPREYQSTRVSLPSEQLVTSDASLAVDIRTVRPDAIFPFNVKLPKASEFYGRVRERETLADRTYHRASTSIVGPRRIGKTWLIEYLMLTARTKLGSRFRMCYLDATLPGCSTVAEFIAKASVGLGISLSGDLATLRLVTLEHAVEDLKQKRQVPVLCVDEFEGFGNQDAFDLSFFTGLRALTQIGLVLVTASRHPLIDIVGDYGKTSGFFNVFEQLTLKPFGMEEAEGFVSAKSRQVGFTEQEQVYLMKYGQAHKQQWPPLRLQLAGKMLLRDKILSVREGSHYYRPNDSSYWEEFELRLEEKYRGVVR